MVRMSIIFYGCECLWLSTYYTLSSAASCSASTTVVLFHVDLSDSFKKSSQWIAATNMISAPWKLTFNAVDMHRLVVGKWVCWLVLTKNNATIQYEKSTNTLKVIGWKSNDSALWVMVMWMSDSENQGWCEPQMMWAKTWWCESKANVNNRWCEPQMM